MSLFVVQRRREDGNYTNRDSLTVEQLGGIRAIKIEQGELRIPRSALFDQFSMGIPIWFVHHYHEQAYHVFKTQFVVNKLTDNKRYVPINSQEQQFIDSVFIPSIQNQMCLNVILKSIPDQKIEYLMANMLISSYRTLCYQRKKSLLRFPACVITRWDTRSRSVKRTNAEMIKTFDGLEMIRSVSELIMFGSFEEITMLTILLDHESIVDTFSFDFSQIATLQSS